MSSPPKATSVSIWKLPILKYLARQAQITTTVMRWYYGAQSPKPTKLITHPCPLQNQGDFTTQDFHWEVGSRHIRYFRWRKKTYPPVSYAPRFLTAAWSHAPMHPTKAKLTNRYEWFQLQLTLQRLSTGQTMGTAAHYRPATQWISAGFESDPVEFAGNMTATDSL